MSSRRNWDSPNPNPSPASECAFPPDQRACPPPSQFRQFRRLEKKLSTLPTLWTPQCGLCSVQSSLCCTLVISRQLFTANSSVHLPWSDKNSVIILKTNCFVLLILNFYEQKSIFWLLDVIFKHFPFVYILQTIFLLQNYLLYWVFKGYAGAKQWLCCSVIHPPPSVVGSSESSHLKLDFGVENKPSIIEPRKGVFIQQSRCHKHTWTQRKMHTRDILMDFYFSPLV